MLDWLTTAKCICSLQDISSCACARCACCSLIHALLCPSVNFLALTLHLTVSAAVSCMQLVGRPGFQATRDVSTAIHSVLGMLRVPRSALGISAASKGAVAGRDTQLVYTQFEAFWVQDHG